MKATLNVNGKEIEVTLNDDGTGYFDINNTKEENLGKYYIVRTYSAGVFAGYLRSRDGREVTLDRARRLWYWDGAATLSQLSVDGVSKPENCKFACEVSNLLLLEAIEILECTSKAKKSIQDVKVWKV